MNKQVVSWIEHSTIAAIIQIVLSFWFGWLAAGWIACAVFLGREIAQHEYKGGDRKNSDPLYGLKHHWTFDSIMDVVCPAIITGILWWLFG